ncbi:glycoside hydrolase family 68 protein [Halospeciosus flavus]|uniref:Glycoside hydrolase family 68 protein n=1 Tax=Halospeciosus flavus TaxID=3032283 RepID=A0ABD5Z8H7_9EURY|nr:glycoside hydrolase family 68 protein [Halospeciosus flavus]
MTERGTHETTRQWGATSTWTREDAARIERTPETTAPVIYPPDEETDPDLHIWDTWLLRERDGSFATFDGWRVVLALTAPAEMLPGKRHDSATIRYFYSKDGKSWQTGGRVFDPERSLGSRQWAGSAMYDRDAEELYLYYTAAGHADAEELSYQQRICVGTGGTIHADESGVDLAGPWDHEVLLTPDGDWYETQTQAERESDLIYTFRDPWFFEDPETGETCLLFEANTPIPEDGCGGDDGRRAYNGCIGVATSPSGDPTEWEMERPILDGACVNQELERPHVVVRDGRYYLFTPSHEHTFAPGLDGFDALYGFVSDSLRGEYEPLNDSGLVVANPHNAPFQAYSWLAYGHRDELLVTSFFNYYDLGGLHLDDVGHLHPDEQREKFGGTLAPTLRIQLAGERTRVLGTLDYGHLPLEDEELPPVDPLAAERPLGDEADGDTDGNGEY